MLTFGVKAPDIARTKQLLAHIPGAAEKAISRAINRAIATANTEAIRGAKDRYTLSDSDLRKGIKIVKASPQRLKATLIATSGLHRVAKFKTGKGPFSEIIKGNTKPWPHAFLAKLKGPQGGTHLGLFAREKEFKAPTQGRYAKTKERLATRGVDRSPVGSSIKRQPIVEAVTVSTSEMLGYHEVIERTMELAGERLDAELARQVDLFLSGKVS